MCCRLVSRVTDEEEVHKLVIRTFQELWFSPPASETDKLARDDVAARCEQMVGVVAAAGTTAQRNGWLQQLLSRLLELPEASKPSKEMAVVLKVCERLVAQMMDTLLQLEEQRGSGKADEKLEERMGNTLHALSLFCNARPRLMLHHVGLLPHFLKNESNNGVIQHTCQMLPPLLQLLERPPSDLLNNLETFLTAIIFRVPEDLIGVAIPALCMAIHRSLNFQLLVETLARFFDFLLRWKQMDPNQAKPKAAAAKRAMLCLGMLCRHFDFDSPSAASVARSPDGSTLSVEGKVNEQVFQLLGAFVSSANPPDIALYALKGIGQMCVRVPELVERCKNLITRVLQPEADLKLKRQALSNLLIILDDDGARQRAAAKASHPMASPTKPATPAVAEMSAKVNGALQQHLPAILASMLDYRDPLVRHAALSLTSALLREGLTHPMKALPKVLALELDVHGGCSDLAKSEMRKHFERHKETLSNPGVAVDAALAAFQFQRKLEQLPPAQMLSPGVTNDAAATRRVARPSFLFGLLGGNRKARHLHLKALLMKLEPGDELLTADKEAWLGIVERSEWVAQTLAELPFDKEDDVLTVIFQINRMLSLSAETTLQLVATALKDDLDQPHVAVELERAVSGELPAQVVQYCHAAAMLSLALMVKRHLKRIYQLNDLRCQTFDPTDPRVIERQTSRLTDGILLDTQQLWSLPSSAQPAATTPAKGAGGKGRGKAKQAAVGTISDATQEAMVPCPRVAMKHPVVGYTWLRELFREDEEEFDYNILTAPPRDGGAVDKPSKPRGRPRKSSEGSKAGGGAKRGRPAKPGNAKKRKGKAVSAGLGSNGQRSLGSNNVPSPVCCMRARGCISLSSRPILPRTMSRARRSMTTTSNECCAEP